MASIAIPDGFLPPNMPENACSRIIDFVTTPLPQYKDLFAAVIDNFLTESECKELTRLAEASTLSGDSTPTWERAMINIGGGMQALSIDTRNCGRIIFDTPVIAQRILDRLTPFLRDNDLETIENRTRLTGLAKRRFGYRLSRLNERLRFLKYEGGEFFRCHCDGFYETPDKEEISFLTVHIYLNGEGEQDLDELNREKIKMAQEGTTSVVNQNALDKLLGGATSFTPPFDENGPAVHVFPKTGSVLVFQQFDLCHSGDPVFRGVKYTLRSDVMYRKYPLQPESKLPRPGLRLFS